MSDIGLYTGIYKDIRTYAELVDQVLIELKMENAHLPNDYCHKLGEFLVTLAEEHLETLPSQRMASLFEEAHIEKTRYLSAGKALLANQADDTVIELLEKLAHLLENKQAHVVAKMRGGIS